MYLFLVWSSTLTPRASLIFNISTLLLFFEFITRDSEGSVPPSPSPQATQICQPYPIIQPMPISSNPSSWTNTSYICLLPSFIPFIFHLNIFFCFTWTSSPFFLLSFCVNLSPDSNNWLSLLLPNIISSVGHIRDVGQFFPFLLDQFPDLFTPHYPLDSFHTPLSLTASDWLHYQLPPSHSSQFFLDLI